jgi:hypothetical protein
MASYGQLDDYQSRCRLRLLKLRLLAGNQDGTGFPREFTVEVKHATYGKQPGHSPARSAR